MASSANDPINEWDALGLVPIYDWPIPDDCAEALQEYVDAAMAFALSPMEGGITEDRLIAALANALDKCGPRDKWPQLPDPTPYPEQPCEFPETPGDGETFMVPLVPVGSPATPIAIDILDIIEGLILAW